MELRVGCCMFLKKLLNFSSYQQARKIIIAAGTSSMSKYNVVFVLGGPGAGKGTQCKNIVKVKLIRLSVLTLMLML